MHLQYPTLADCIGNTPLIRLQRLGQGRGNQLLVKLEGNNPAGSVKDRAAFAMIENAERSGRIRPGQRLIEATSGNTGIALAMVAAVASISLCPGRIQADRGNFWQYRHSAGD